MLKKEIQQFDLLHLHSVYLWPTSIAARMAEQYCIPYIVSPHGMLIKDLIRRKNRLLKSVWLWLVEKRTVEKATAIHTTTALEAKEIRHFHFKIPPVMMVPIGVDNGILDSSLSSQQVSSNINHVLEKKPMLLFLGRISWKKGFDRLIPALSYVSEAHLVIAGNDEENYIPALKRLASDYGVGERITFAGPIYGEDKVALLKNAALLVLPSYSENFGIAVLEAMAVGCPVVVTPEVGLADVIKKTQAGLVSEGDPKILGENLRSLLGNLQQRREMGESGQKAVREHFTWDSIAKQMEDMYRQAIGQP
jgi:glycosyltransferase involved in cell wall biosynthesis